MVKPLPHTLASLTYCWLLILLLRKPYLVHVSKRRGRGANFGPLVVFILNDLWVPTFNLEFDNVALIGWLEWVDHVYISRGFVSIPTRQGNEEATRNKVFFGQVKLNFWIQNNEVVKSPSSHFNIPLLYCDYWSLFKENKKNAHSHVKMKGRGEGCDFFLSHSDFRPEWPWMACYLN